MDTPSVTYSDPPPKMHKGRPERFSAEVLEDIKANSPAWARFDGYKDTNSASSVSSRFRSMGFQTTARTEDGGGVLYIRWPES